MIKYPYHSLSGYFMTYVNTYNIIEYVKYSNNSFGALNTFRLHEITLRCLNTFQIFFSNLDIYLIVLNTII